MRKGWTVIDEVCMKAPGFDKSWLSAETARNAADIAEIERFQRDGGSLGFIPCPKEAGAGVCLLAHVGSPGIQCSMTPGTCRWRFDEVRL